MRGDLVVVSWWSNCLGLTCLYNLVRHTGDRNIYVIQVGKSASQRERFRQCLPARVIELPYAADLPAEHGRVIEAVAGDLLSGCEALWFCDHDFLVLEDMEPWLVEMDRRLGRSVCCMCHPQSAEDLAITCPIFWLSPSRFPEGLPSFDPIPYQPMRVSQRPDLFRAPADLRLPEKDTLVLAQEFLAERGMSCQYPLQSLPRYEHLGGLYLFANEVLPESFRDWMDRCVGRFTHFFAACPPAWLDIEDPVLMERLEEFQQAVSR